MSDADLGVDEVTLPIKRTEGETLTDRLTDNAYHNILPARYLRKDADGELVEDQEDLFERVAKNIALAEAVYEARNEDVEITVTPEQLKPDHPRRDELAEEVFGKGTTVTDDAETTLSIYNVNKFAYETVVPELPPAVREHVEDTAAEFRTLMGDLSFMPNSPTLMNAGDELQQLSACFVDSPEDDIDDIHQTAKEAAQVFQCLTEDTTVTVEGKGVVSIADVEPGDRIVQRDGDDHRVQNVDETHAYDDSPVKRVETKAGVELTGTPNHELLVGEDWTRIDEIEPGDALSLRLGWIDGANETPELTTVAGGAQWAENRTVSNDDVLELYADGLSDYEIAERLDSSASTIQRRRSLELGLDPNGSGGRPGGSVSFDESEFETLYEDGHSDGEIARELGVSTRSVARYRENQSIESNGEAVTVVDQPTELTPDLAELVGMWVGDGSKHEDGIRFHLNREETLERADRLARDLFDVGLDWRWDEGCYDAVVHSHEVKRWWLANFGDAKPDATSASVPESVWKADRETIGAFLRGLYSTDGSLQKDVYPRLWSSSEDLIEGVQQLLLGLGIPAINWEYDTEDRDYFNVGPTGERGLEQFSNLVGFVDSRSETMAETLASIDSEGPSVGTLDGSTWHVPVEAVEDAGTATVYDVTVADNHEYVASSVVSHNSGGGMGYAFWRLRPYGDAVGSTGGIASGPITFMRTFDQMCETIAQGGARRGAQMGVMRISHPDAIQFIHAKNKDVSLAHTLRLNDPDDFTHTSFADALEEARELIDDEGRVPEHLRNAVEGHLSNFNISVGVTDDFMEALQNGEEFTFTNPRTGEAHIVTEETKELYDMFGLGEYVTVGEELSVPAEELWDDIVEGAHENGEPGVIYLERVNKEHSFDVEAEPDHQILATNPCVTGDTLISTENGLVPAEELYEHGVAQDVVVDGRLSEDRVKEASSVFKTGEKDVYELTTEEGYELRLTADHRVMTDDGWIEAQNLEPGDTVHVQNQKGEFGQHGSAEEGRVLGWLVGDGHLKHGEERAVLNFYDEDATVSEQFADDVNEIVREPLGNADYEVGVSDISRSDDYRGAQALEQRIRSARLYEYAEETGLIEEKLQVPDAVMRGSEEMARGFLRALFSADGSVQGDVEKGVSVRLASVDAGFLTDVQRLLLNFGIASKVYEDRKEPGTVELPDGTGDTAEYETEGFHELVVVKDNLVRFAEEVGFLLDSKDETLAERLAEYDRGPYSERFEATVESVEFDGHEAVYDLTEPDTHSFIANGLVCHNCGEQPLEEYEACNLGHINLSTVADTDAPDWRVWSDRHAEDYADFEDAIDAYLEEAIDFEELDHRIAMGTRFLENVVTMSDFPVDEIEEKVRHMRKIGLGIMGLAQLYIQLGVKYGSEEADEIARQVMQHINYESKWTSHELAEERGSFAEWDDSKYADPTEYSEWFEHYVGEDAEDWADGFPIRNHNTTTIAPTGCVEESSLISTDEGLVPIEDLDETTAEFQQWDEIDVGVATDGGTKAATAIYDNGFTYVRKIETEGGFSVASTPDHRFRTLTEDGEYAWKEAGEFEPGDRILLQRNTFEGGTRATLDTSERDNYHHNTDDDLTLPEEMTPELSEFLGYFMGDGYVHDEVGVKVVVESDATELDEHLRELGRSLFGVAPTVEDQDTRHTLTFGGRHLSRYFEDNGWKKAPGNEGQGAASAFVPDEVLSGDEPVAKAFLRGLFEADGTASRKVELSTVSATLAEEVQTLLLSLGCVFVQDVLETEDMDDHYGDRPRHSVRGANRREDARFIDEIGFITKSTEFDLGPQSYKNDTYPPEIVETLRAVDGYDSVSKPVKKRVNQSPINGAVSRKLVKDVETETDQVVRVAGRRLTDFYAATVGSVTEEKAYTKDISVPSNNTYVANGFVTHNTTSMVGNTTGGCEPVYNVAYYKNVSDDVQGDEMLVEFDDYFLRVLEENDIDVEAVKREAQEQMADNAFDGVEGLSTVPDAIGELFVTTGDLSPKQHASIQCALQDGVDSAISKTVNAPNDSTLGDAKDVFEYIYEHGGKGVTYYRDGTRSKQVLTTRAENTDFADMDEDEAAETIVERIDEVFGGLEGFLDNEDVRERLTADIEELLDGDTARQYAEKKPRPDQLHGVTQRIETGYGKLYVTINEDPKTGEPFELFANTGHSGGFTNSFTDALAKTISVALRSGVDPDEIVDKLQGIRSPKVAWDKGEQINSIPDAFGTALRRYLDDEIDRTYPQQRTLEETADEDLTAEEQAARSRSEDRSTDGGSTATESTMVDDQQDIIANGESPECPECGSMSLYYSEGCKTCESCGWSEC
nr:LAGLIDADG family homing endonuclease [Halorhabdus amylolytica]